MRLAPAPASLAARCDAPVLLPDRDLTQAEVEQLWDRDRAALVRCGWRLDAFIQFYASLRASLAAADRSDQ